MEINNRRIFGLLTLAALPIWVFTLKLSLNRVISTDEFTFLHASWLMANGLVPVKDFYLPLPYFSLILAPLWKIASWDFTGVLVVRTSMQFFFLLAVAAGAALMPKSDKGRWWLPVILLFTTPSFVRWMTEVRPDAAGFAFFLAACAVMYRAWLPPRQRALVIGALIMLSMIVSVKAVVYAGVPMVIATAIEARLKHGIYFLNLGSLAFFILGCAGLLTIGALYWVFSFSLFGWLSDLSGALWRHETLFPSTPWTGFFVQEMRLTGAALPFAVVGLLRSFRAHASVRDYVSSADFFLALSLVFSFLSIVIQRAPFPHSIVPFAGLLAVLAAQGMSHLLSGPSWRHRMVFACLVANSVFAMLVYDTHAANTNRAQRALIEDVSRLTAEGDVIYDNAGEFVVRRSAWYYFFTDDMLRRVKWDSMTAEVTDSLIQRQCVGWVRDSRFRFLPPDLQAFLLGNYVEYRDRLYLAGWKFTPAESQRPLSRSFSVIKGGTYFLSFEGDKAPVFIDGKEITGGKSDLQPGPHDISFGGPIPTVSLLWLPKDGRSWTAR